jgi:hypothetical protein
MLLPEKERNVDFTVELINLLLPCYRCVHAAILFIFSRSIYNCFNSSCLSFIYLSIYVSLLLFFDLTCLETLATTPIFRTMPLMPFKRFSKLTVAALKF